MLDFRDIRQKFIAEGAAGERHHVFAFGRMNPVTTGHEKLVKRVKELADKFKAGHSIVVSASKDPKKNPLSAAQKLKHARRFFPNTNISAATKEAPTFMHHLRKLHAAGVTHLHFVAGSDRLPEYDKLIKQYNGKKGEFNFKKVTMHSAGERDPDAEGAEGMSASKMREHASKGNFAEFRKGVPAHVSDKHAKEMYDEVRKGMQLKEEQSLFEGVYDPAIFKAVFLAGGPGSGKDFVLGKIISGFGLVEVSSDPFLSHLMTKHKLDLKMPEHETSQRDLVRGRAKNLEQEKKRLVIAGRLGIIVNGVADEVNKILYKKKELEELGYDTMMVFVNTSDEVSRQRNIERGQMGGRTVPEAIRSEKWKGAQEARKHFAIMFGEEHFISVDNSEDIRFVSPEVRANIERGFLQMNKKIRGFINTPPSKPDAKSWIQNELKKKKMTYREETMDSLFEDSFVHGGSPSVLHRSSYGGKTRHIARTSDTSSLGHQPAAHAPDAPKFTHRQERHRKILTVKYNKFKKEDWTTDEPITLNWTAPTKSKDKEWTAFRKEAKADAFPRDFDTTMALTTPSGAPAAKGYLSPRLGEGNRKKKEFKKILKEIETKSHSVANMKEHLLENIDDLM